MSFDHEHDDHHGHGPDVQEDWPSTERLSLRSVGIDIGSSTSHVLLSTIVMERQGARLSSRFDVVERRVEGRSPVWFTPYTAEGLIDAEAVAALVAEAYRGMGVTGQDIQTGAVIVTGEAARRANAARIVEAVAAYAGDFVCATAGPVLEGVLAAHGSGAVATSRRRGLPVLNVDVGGGTTKLGLVRGGEVVQVHAVNVGGRLLAWDGTGALTRVEEAGRRLAAHAGVEVAHGVVLGDEQVRAVARVGAAVVLDAVRGDAAHPLAEALEVTPALGPHGVDLLLFSGGVGALVQDPPGPDDPGHGDLGGELAAALRELVEQDQSLEVAAASETLRATAIGVAQFTVQVSGNTIGLGGAAGLPVRNQQVVAVRLERLDDAATVADDIRAALASGARADGDADLALALRVPRPERPSMLAALADGLAAAMPRSLAAPTPFVVTVDQDVAGMLGHLLHEHAERVVVLDQVVVDDLDYLDVGRLQPASGVVPVVVKSLVF